jgi:hypothetical protein
MIRPERSRVEHEALDDGNRHGESPSYRPAGDHGAEISDERWLLYRVRLGVVGGVSEMGPRKELGERKRSAKRRTRLNIVRCE